MILVKTFYWDALATTSIIDNKWIFSSRFGVNFICFVITGNPWANPRELQITYKNFHSEIKRSKVTNQKSLTITSQQIIFIKRIQVKAMKIKTLIILWNLQVVCRLSDSV